ncbi:MAG: PqqD family protein [Prevotellaceae bacterium]|nr:PqqD family protein [Candidatus Minthosoma equi]
MKIDNSFKIRTVCGENIVMRQGHVDSDMTQVVSLNSTAAEMWKFFEGKEFTAADVVSYLKDTYGIDDELAKTDAEKWIAKLSGCGFIG